MGIDYEVYVGPFIKATYSVCDQLCEVFGCKKCKKEIDGKFCSICGSKLGKFEILKKNQSNVCEMIDEMMDDCLSCVESGNDNIHMWLSNMVLNCRDFNFEPRLTTPGIVAEINSKEVEEEIKLFKQTFKKETDILKKYYDKIEIFWGIINYN